MKRSFSLVAMAGCVISCGLACAQPPPPSVSGGGEKRAEWLSPDGKFGFIQLGFADSEEPNARKLDVIDIQSHKVVLEIVGDEDLDIHWRVLWAPDSKRFALMTRYGHPLQGLDVYAQHGDAFRKVELPELPEARIPERLKHGKRYPHVGNLNWKEAIEWKSDGSLVVEIQTSVDGENGSLSATRAVVLGFDRAGKATIAKSSIKYEATNE